MIYYPNMHTTNYFDTFISTSEDCPARTGEEPPIKDPKTAARIQFEMLLNHPYQYTSDDVIYASNGERRNINREEFFSKGQACFRSSPLVKRYGWGIHSDANGKIAIYPVESPEYNHYASNSQLKQLKGMRSSRA